MCHRNRTLRRSSLITAVGLALCLAISASAKPPSWDKKIEGKGRFKVLKAFDDEAVLDKETGLVWQQATNDTTVSWRNAMRFCQQEVTGERGGWRLPRYEELATLINPVNGDLPAAHPFDVPEDIYWVATTVAGNDGAISTLTPVLDTIDGAFTVTAKDGSVPLRVWCVRGGASIDDQ